MVTCGICGSQLSCRSNDGSSNGRVEAYTTWPLIPPFSPAAYGSLPNSMKLFWPGKPCQPSTPTQGGSIRPVESLVEQVTTPVVEVVQTLGGSLAGVWIDLPVQSALAQ